MYFKRANTPQDNIVAQTYKKYQTQLQIANAMDLDDLLMYPYLMFRQYPKILEKTTIRLCTQFPHSTTIF